jgi:hypothetical protein
MAGNSSDHDCRMAHFDFITMQANFRNIHRTRLTNYDSCIRFFTQAEFAVLADASFGVASFLR